MLEEAAKYRREGGAGCDARPALYPRIAACLPRAGRRPRVKAAVRFSVINTLLGKHGAARQSRLTTRRGIGNN